MMFIFGFICGLIFVALSYLVIRTAIIKYGEQINDFIMTETQDLKRASRKKSQIIFPDDSIEKFKKSDKIDDLLKE